MARTIMIALVAITVVAKATGLIRVAPAFSHRTPLPSQYNDRPRTPPCAVPGHRHSSAVLLGMSAIDTGSSSAPVSSSGGGSSSGSSVKSRRKAPTAAAPAESARPTQKPRTRLTADDKFHRDVKALAAFFKLHGHLRVPYYYVIPTNDTVSQSTNWRTRRKTNALAPLPAGTGAGPAGAAAPSFRVSDCYPPDTHGLRLGLRVARMRKGELHVSPEQRARLVALGLPVGEREGSGGGGEADDDGDADAELRWSARAHTSDQQFTTILAALKAHDALFGDMLVPRYAPTFTRTAARIMAKSHSSLWVD